MLTQLKCEGDIAEQLAPKYITHSSSLSINLSSFGFQMDINYADYLSLLYLLHIIFESPFLTDDACCFSLMHPFI
jgi:hypothetical protein